MPLHETVANVADGDMFSVSASNGRSYCCQLLRTGGASPTVDIAGFTNFGSVVPIARGRELPAVLNSENRYCWVDSIGSDALYSAARGFTLGSIATTAEAQFSCEETTLYGNYNTSVSEFNFLELTGRTSSTGARITVTIRLKSSITGIATSTSQTLTLDGTTGDTVRRDISIHDLLGGAADFGDIKISHDGAPGQLSARVSQYDITSAVPLNFTLVGQDVLPRGTSGR